MVPSSQVHMMLPVSSRNSWQPNLLLPLGLPLVCWIPVLLLCYLLPPLGLMAPFKMAVSRTSRLLPFPDSLWVWLTMTPPCSAQAMVLLLLCCK